jgi:maleate isomerase
MPDSLGWRQKFAVLIPSTNTSVQPEFDDMRPPGVTNHISRIRIPNIPLHNDADFERLIALIAATQDEAVDSAMSCEPDRLVLGISAETFWDGLNASRKLKAQLHEHTGLPVSMGSEACEAAFLALRMKKIAVITPYQPVGSNSTATTSTAWSKWAPTWPWLAWPVRPKSGSKNRWWPSTPPSTGTPCEGRASPTA